MTALGQGLVGLAQTLVSTTLDLPLLSAVIITESGNGHDPLSVALEQVSSAVPRPPKPKWSIVDRPGRIGVPSYDGQDPYEYSFAVRIDGYPGTSVERQITILEGFAEAQGGQPEPAILKVAGAIPLPHPNLLWRLTAIDDPSEQLFLPGGQERCRYVTVITLTQHVTGADVSKSIQQNSGSKAIQVKTATVQANENSLFDLARRYYHDTSRATDIARANLIQLGDRLKQGQKLRMPV